LRRSIRAVLSGESFVSEIETLSVGHRRRDARRGRLRRRGLVDVDAVLRGERGQPLAVALPDRVELPPAAAAVQRHHLQHRLAGEAVRGEAQRLPGAGHGGRHPAAVTEPGALRLGAAGDEHALDVGRDGGEVDRDARGRLQGDAGRAGLLKNTRSSSERTRPSAPSRPP
jgi:hypothetical protein